MNFDLERREVTFSIKEFPSNVQAQLLSTLDINGFISNEPKFREIVATNLSKLPGLSPKEAKRLHSIIVAGALLPVFRDAEKNQFGLNFALNTYTFSLDTVPGKPEIPRTAMPISPVELTAASTQSPVEKVQMDGRTYSIRVFESDPYKPIGNWTLDVSEDDNLIFRTTIVRWPGQGADIIDSFVLTDDGSWQDADSDDIAAISKLKDAMISATRKYEEWSISRGPKSDMMSSEEWTEYKKLHGIEKEAVKIDRICAWCKKKMGEVEVPRSDNSPTHGICPDCIKKIDPGAHEELYDKKAAKRKRVFVDFDGTITDKAHGRDIGKPADGAKESLQKLKDQGYTIVIYSVRANGEEGKKYITDFLTSNGIPFDDVRGKPDFDFYIDDKAISIGHGNTWSDVLNELNIREKKGAFMPSLPGQPFWGQYGQGEDHADYVYPLENLYPAHTHQPEGEPEAEDYQDTSAEYAKIPGKRKPGWMWQLLKKFMPVGKASLEKLAAERPALTYRDPELSVAPSELLFDIDVPSPDAEPFKCKLQATLASEGNAPATRKEESDIIYKPLSNKDFKSIVTDVSNLKKVIYDIKFVEGEGGPDVTPGEIVATIDATDFFKYPHKKKNVGNDMKEWLVKRMSTKAAKEHLPRFLDRVKRDAPSGTRKSWETSLFRDIVSGDFVSALAQVSPETPNANIIRRNIISWWFGELFQNQKYEDLLVIAKAHRLGEIDPKTRKWIPNKSAEEYSDKQLGYIQQSIAMAGLGLRTSTGDYATQVDTILHGNDDFPQGSSIETKSKVIQRAGASFLEDFVKDKGAKKVKFAEQPYSVQLETYRKLASYKQAGESGLWAMWENKEVPTSIRKLVLQTLVEWYGVGGLWGEGGEAKYILPPESDSSKGNKKTILSEALEDPETRQIAYALMVSEKLPYLPWTSEGKLVYDESMKEPARNQPSRAIPEWLIAQLNREPHWEYRSIIINKILKELPQDLVTEEEPIEFAADGKTIVNQGKVAIAGKPIKGLEWFLNLALRDPSKNIRSVVRNHFKLPAEKVPSAAKPTEKYIEPDKQDSAQTFLFNAEGLLSHREYAKAAEQLKAAKNAKDAAKWSKEIGALEKQIKDAITSATTRRKELIAEKDAVLDQIRDKYSEHFKDSGLKRSEDLEKLLDFATQYFSQSDSLTPFNKLSLQRQLDVAKKVLELPQIVAAYFQRLKGEPEAAAPAPKEVQPELPLKQPTQPPKAEEWSEEGDLFKQGGPLGRLELEARQPPTTWPLENPQAGYGSAFPLGAKNDELLLKDVNQFIGRPRGKYKADFSFWRWLLSPKKDEGDDADTVPEEVEKKASAETEETLLAKLKAREPLDSILPIAEEHHFKKVVDAAWSMVKDKKTPDHNKVLDIYVRWNDVDALVNAIDSTWASEAITRLINLKQLDRVEEVYKSVDPAIQERIVLHLGEMGNLPFLVQALNNDHENVRRQAVQWLSHYDHLDVLEKHLEKEKDPKVIAEINKQLALKGVGPLSKGIEPMKEEKGSDTADKAIKALIDKATKAFTRWDIYPSVRTSVLKNYTARPYYEWLRSQPSIDEDINEEMSKLPTVEQGKEALEDLKKILEKLPSIEPAIKWRTGWLAENEERYTKETDPKVKEQLRIRIDQIKQQLAADTEAVEGSLGDLSFQVANLERLYNEAKLREEVISGIKQTKSFKKEYPDKGLWTDYQAYLKTFEDVPEDLESKYKPAAEGLNTSEKARAKLVWAHTEPLRKAYNDAMDTVNKADKALAIAAPAEVESLAKELEKYKRLEIAWLKQMGAIEPHVVIDEEYYKLMPPVWSKPRTPSISPEYSKSLQLIPGGKVMKMRHDSRNPFRFKIEELEKGIKALDEKALQDATSKLSKEDKKILEEGQKAQYHAEQIVSKINKSWPMILPPGYNISDSGPKKFAEPTLQQKVLSKVRKEYDEERKKLYERIKNMHKLSESDPEYVTLKKDVEDFRKKYSVPPMGDNPDVNARRQWHIDSGTSPSVAEPMILPEVREPRPLGILDRPRKNENG